MRENDSRNEVFLSALDLFTLLLFAFIGVAWQSRLAGRTSESLPLPITRTDTPTVPVDIRDVAKVLWADESVGGLDGATCKLRLIEPNGTEQRFDVPCWPAAFSAMKLPPDRRLRDRCAGRRVLAVCPPGEVGLEACARLVLVARDHSLDAAVLVGKP